MISNLVFMDGNGIYVWSAFAFTFIGFSILYFIINLQLKKEQKRFEKNFSALTQEKFNVAINKKTYKEILKNSVSKI